MKGFIRQFAAVCGFGAILFSLAGCYCYRNLVDPCWPERYNVIARESVREMHNAQAQAGHELGQTIYLWHFEVSDKGPTARLNPAGIETLKTISRRKPVPDGHLFLQNAQDIPYVPGVNPEEIVRKREQLNHARIRAIEEFMFTQTAVLGGGYHVVVRDLATPTGDPNLNNGAYLNIVDLTRKGQPFPFENKGQKAGF
jgi:hypothetical protein